MKKIIQFINRKYIGECELDIFNGNIIKYMFKIFYFLRKSYIYIISFFLLPLILLHKKFEDELDMFSYFMLYPDLIESIDSEKNNNNNND